jgi:hypothetical protein
MRSRSGRHTLISHASRVAACIIAVCTGVSACSRQSADPAPNLAGTAPPITPAPAQPITQLTPDLYVVSTRAANMAVLAGKDSSLIVGPQLPSLDSAARTLLAEHHAGAVRMVVVAPEDSAAVYADGGWGRDDALVLTHENLRARMSQLRHSGATLPAAAAHSALPTLGFSEVVQMYVDGNSVHAIHHRAGYSDADLIVHFEDANVVYLGNTLTTDGYPAIDLGRGGSLAGMIETIESFKPFPATTRFIPGRGPVASKQTLDAYGAMLVDVLGRVKHDMDAGQSEAQVVASKPTAGYDARWGHGAVSADTFVQMVYESLTADGASR